MATPSRPLGKRRGQCVPVSPAPAAALCSWPATNTSDVMNFGQTAKALTRLGIDTRTLLVTNDLASAPPQEMPKRHGIAGDFVVLKVASAAAHRRTDPSGRHGDISTRI